MAFGETKTRKSNNADREAKRQERMQSMYPSYSDDTVESSFTKKYPKGIIVDLPMELIDLNEDNDKTFNMEKVPALAQAIKEHGYNRATPVAVYEKPNGRYEINEGHTRFLAMKMLEEKFIPAFIKESVSEIKRTEDLLLSNINNREFTGMDWAKALDLYVNKVLKARGFTGNMYDEAAKFFGKSSNTLMRYHRVERLSEKLKILADDNRVPFSALIEAVVLTEDNQDLLYEDVVAIIGEKNVAETGVDLSKKALLEKIDSYKKKQKKSSLVDNSINDFPDESKEDKKTDEREEVKEDTTDNDSEKVEVGAEPWQGNEAAPPSDMTVIKVVYSQLMKIDANTIADTEVEEAITNVNNIIDLCNNLIKDLKSI